MSMNYGADPSQWWSDDFHAGMKTHAPVAFKQDSPRTLTAPLPNRHAK